MPDAMGASYNQWTGRKTTSLRRPRLDCDCPNNGEVSYHLWCDRLACQKHADAPHDCSQFKGRSSSDEEAVPDEAVVEGPAPSQRRVIPGPDRVHAAFRAEVIRQGFSTCQVDGVTYSVDQPPTHTFDWRHANVTVMTEAEAVRYRETQKLSLECSRHRPMCSGCDGLAMDNFPCVHNCHGPAVRYNEHGWYEIAGLESWHGSDDPAYLRSLLADDEHRTLHRRAQAVLDFVTRMEVSAPPVAAVVEPDPCGHRAELLFGHVGVCTRPAGREDVWHQDDTGARWSERLDVEDIATSTLNLQSKPDPLQATDRPWWRRILRGGQR